MKGTGALFKVCFLGLIVSGCAAPTTRQAGINPELIAQEEEKQKELALTRDRDYNQRLQRVAWPILAASAPLCEEETIPRLGINYANIHVFDDSYQEAASRVYALDDRVRIIHVTPGSPAERAGLLDGDILLRINETTVPAGKKAVEKVSDALDKGLEQGTAVSFAILRGNDELRLDVVAQETCRFGAQLVPTEELNAYADGNGIYVTRGMMRFADEDQELAVVIAHELAHNSEGHIAAKTKNYLFGAIFDVAAALYGANTQGAFANAAAQAYSKEFEAEADYVGMYAMALAGLNVSDAANFWREMGAENPGSISKAYATTHPSTAERFLAIENASVEIETKIRHGIPLEPERE